MKAILVTCPHCGARVEVAGEAAEVRCDYCGTAARVQRRTRVFERALPAPATGPAAIAVQQRHGRRVVGILIAAVALPLLIGGVVGWVVIMKPRLAATAAGPAGTARAKDAPGWQSSGGLIVVDLDGNGIPDVIGRSHRARKDDEVRIIALDGATGTPLWESELLGTLDATREGTLALAGDQVVFGSPRGEVRAFAARTGAPLWRTQLDERVIRFCDGGPALLIAVGADERERPLVRATGMREPSPAVPAEAAEVAEGGARSGTGRRPSKRSAAFGPPPCLALPGDGAQHWKYTSASRKLASELGFSSAKRHGHGGRVLSGSREEGTRVAMLAAVDALEAVRWKVVVARDPLAVLARDPRGVIVGEQEVCVGYFGESVAKPSRLACFALADGTRLWDVEADDPLAIVGRTVLVRSRGLQLRDITTGAVRWTFGN